MEYAELPTGLDAICAARPGNFPDLAFPPRRTPRLAVLEPASTRATFLDQTWCRVDTDGSMLVGIWSCRDALGSDASLEVLPVGSQTHWGLPMAAYQVAPGAIQLIPAPATGTVLEVYGGTPGDRFEPGRLLHSGSWFARIHPTSPVKDLGRNEKRAVLLLSTSGRRRELLRRRLEDLGLWTILASSAAGLEQAVRDTACRVLVFDIGARTRRESEGLLGGCAKQDLNIVALGEPGTGTEALTDRFCSILAAIEDPDDDQLVSSLERCYGPQSRKAIRSESPETLEDSAFLVDLPRRLERKAQILIAPRVLQEHPQLLTSLDRTWRHRTGLAASMTMVQTIGTAIRDDVERGASPIVVTLQRRPGLPGSVEVDQDEAEPAERQPAPTPWWIRISPVSLMDGWIMDSRTTSALATLIADLASDQVRAVKANTGR